MYRKTYSFPLLFLCSIMILCSCASSYKSINPKDITYSAQSDDSDITLSYKYNVLKESGNKKYAKKEEKKNLQLVAIKISNTSDSSITLAENISLYSGGMPVFPVEPEIIKNQLKQNTPLYLLYSLLWLQVSNCDNGGCNTTNLPIGIPIAIGNMAVAGTANGNLKKELDEYDILNEVISPGETVYGIIGIRDTGYNPLAIKFRE